MKYFWMILFFPLGLFSQFSPGPLSKYHAHLEGTTNCTQCHELGKKELSDGCVLCHSPVKEKIDAKKGYHANKSTKCGECHSDHNGKEFELVYWPKDLKKFKHEETGYNLTGAHKNLDCRKCHNQKLIREQSIIQWASKNSQTDVLGRTFLGLEETCNSCHENIHKEQVSNDCASCHNSTDWKLALKEFDHNRAKFLLTGAHKNVDCIKCHLIIPGEPKKLPQLTGMAYQNCFNCHKDYHQGTYGPSCEKCHTTNNWKKDLKPFDHSKTKYPLEGKHVGLLCNQCHKSITPGKLPLYDKCQRCHADKHYEQFAKRPDGGDCAPCHTLSGFKPSKFTLVTHQAAKLVLDGAHIAVPCNKCHEPFEVTKGILTTRFTWDNYTCNVCHKDVHRNQFTYNLRNDCGKCHTTTIFKTVTFDHQTSSYPLDGRHQFVKCIECHKSENDAVGSFTRYSPVPHQCKDCHTLTIEIQ